ncbi:aldolase catalytic domain-containing protein [Pontibacter harenae]|uniref:aldolase catalytic domain-containing protein n=1 Tax=Pontibacter harenae TaxID=2894083 RepID=UPI001E5AF450|nr:aldolase catalytic domain-containing protein [Pontibacter harenae]MCC9168238.1 aldolase catalytic domain-containing protein [Pontibacter harenae]
MGLNIKILDCTLRDGGYYTNWDFDKALVEQYVSSINQLPIEYLEVGYRSIPKKGYLGKYFYCPIYELEYIRELSEKKLVLILNEKDTKLEYLNNLLLPVKGLVHMIRMAIDPQNIAHALLLAARIKEMGFEVGFNVMYMSKWKEYVGFFDELQKLDGIVDYFYMVDSYGGVYPSDVIETISLIKQNSKCKIGFHGHNNLELALINSITAIEHGADIVDSTVLGMGRGAGNLKTELLLSVLNSKYELRVDFNAVGNAVNAFQGLLAKHQWGTNLPYMISGSNSLPQKDVMEWVTARFYSFNSIIRALQNQKDKLIDNEQLPKFKPSKSFTKVAIIGGGKNAVDHAKAVRQYIEADKNICIIHASSKNASFYSGINVDQYFCLVGNEGHRLERVFKDLGDFVGKCILPPFPRKMGTYIPPNVYERSFELDKVDFTNKLTDSHTVLALQAAIDLKAEEIFFVGYDGYQEVPVTQLERMLANENEVLFTCFKEYFGKDLVSLTPTQYQGLTVNSIYSLLYEREGSVFSSH